MKIMIQNLNYELVSQNFDFKANLFKPGDSKFKSPHYETLSTGIYCINS